MSEHELKAIRELWEIVALISHLLEAADALADELDIAPEERDRMCIDYLQDLGKEARSLLLQLKLTYPDWEPPVTYREYLQARAALRDLKQKAKGEVDS